MMDPILAQLTSQMEVDSQAINLIFRLKMEGEEGTFIEDMQLIIDQIKPLFN